MVLLVYMNYMKNFKLPHKPSELLKLALTDLELVEKDNDYTVVMSTWHHRGEDGVCAVCLAGSVMAKTCNLDINESFICSENKHMIKDQDKFIAIDALRKGYLHAALKRLKIHSSIYNILPEFYVLRDYQQMSLSYNRSPSEFKEHMCTIIGILESEGL